MHIDLADSLICSAQWLLQCAAPLWDTDSATIGTCGAVIKCTNGGVFPVFKERLSGENEYFLTTVTQTISVAGKIARNKHAFSYAIDIH